MEWDTSSSLFNLKIVTIMNAETLSNFTMQCGYTP